MLNAEGQPHHATVDHLYSRLHPLRPTKHASGHDRNNVLHVLACASCNQERGRADNEGRVFIPKIEARRETAELASAVIGREVTINYPKKPEKAVPPMRVICTIGEAIAWARAEREKPVKERMQQLIEYAKTDDPDADYIVAEAQGIAKATQ